MYNYINRQKFVEVIESKKKKDIEFVKAIKKAIPKILANPYLNDSWMLYEYRGMHKKYIGRAKYRILFATCEECRKLKNDKILRCNDCGDLDPKTVVFFHAYKKPEGL